MNHSTWKTSQYKGYTSVVGENEHLRVEVVPERGSKLVSFINKESGREWVFDNREPWQQLQYGMQWVEGDRSGWDEMFPTILACPCPNEPWQGSAYPDHGEVWALPWQYEITDQTVIMIVHGVVVPYQLRKTYRLLGKELRVDYEVHNPTPFPISYMWAAHSLLAIKPGMQLITEPQLKSVQYQYSHGDRLASKPYARSAYPLAQTAASLTDLSRMEQNEGRHAEKYWFEQELQQGLAGIYDEQTGDSLTYLFKPEEVPYLAVWANYGAFWGEYHFAFEPATGYLDDVYMAHVMQKVKQVQGYGSNGWTFTISVDPRNQRVKTTGDGADE